jgi:hypothetical protein
MAKSSNPKRKKVPKTVLKLPDLERVKIRCAEQPSLFELPAFLRSCDS